MAQTISISKSISLHKSAALKFCFKTCVAMKFVGDDDDKSIHIIQNRKITMHSFKNFLQLFENPTSLKSASFSARSFILSVVKPPPTMKALRLQVVHSVPINTYLCDDISPHLVKVFE